MRVSVVIPTYNEAHSIGLVLADIPAGMVEQVIVVDSDSTDGTAQIACQMGPRFCLSRGVAMAAPVSPALPQSMRQTSSCSWTGTTAIVRRRISRAALEA